MHRLISRPWRHRLLTAHIAAGAGALGAGFTLWAWSGKGLARANAATSVVAAHLALVAILLGLVALGRRYRRIVRKDRETSGSHEGKPNDA